MDVSCSNMMLINSLVVEDFFNAKPEQKFNAIFLILKRTLQAIDAFKNKEFKKFDAIVGDQACQIRALKVIQLFQNQFKIEKTQFQLRFDEMENLINEKETNIQIIKDKMRILSKKTGVKDFQIEKKKSNEDQKAIKDLFIKKGKSIVEDVMNNDFEVSEELLFLLRSYFLTITAECVNGKTYPTTIKPTKFEIKPFKCMEAFGDKAFNQMQVFLSRQSVEFVKKLAEEQNFLIDRLKEKVIKKRVELPFLYMTEVIFKSALEQNIPIILKVEGNNSSHRFAFIKTFSKKNDQEKEVAALVIEAFSEKSNEDLKSEAFDQLVREDTILNQINLNAAQHNQYTDEEDIDEDQRKLKKEASETGFSITNFNMFCITHVFCDLLANQIRKNA